MLRTPSFILFSSVLALTSAPAELVPRATPAAPPAKEAASKPMAPDAVAKLLAQLKEIDDSYRTKRNSYALSLVPRLLEAGGNDDKAFTLWLEATKDQDYEAEGKSATDFSDFRNGKAKDLRNNPSFTTQLRLQCRFLALLIQQAGAVSDSQHLEVANNATAFVEDYVTAAKKITGRQEELRRSALDSVIAKYLKLDILASRAGTAGTNVPGSIGGVYQQMIFPYYREKRAATALAGAWNKRISQETALVESAKAPAQLEKFQKERLPELKWQQAKDLFEAGQQETAAASMVALIKANPAHRATEGWIGELSSLLKNGSSPSTSAIATPDQPVPTPSDPE